MPVPSAVMSVPTSADDSILLTRAFSTFRSVPFSASIACVRRSRPCFAEPPAESPSTRNISDSAGSRSWQSASLPGRPARSSAPLRRVISRALRADSRAGVFLQELVELGADRGLDDALDLRGDQLVLRLRGELRVGHLHRQDRRQSFARAFAGGRDLVLRGELLFDVVVKGPCQRAAETRHVRTAILLRDVVGVRVHALLVRVVPLQ